MTEIDALLEEIAELKALIAAQQEVINTLKGELGEEPEPETKIDDEFLRFETLEDLLDYAEYEEWERLPHNMNSVFFAGISSQGRDTRWYKDAYVEETGKYYERRTVAVGPDFFHIGRFAVVDTTHNTPWVACIDDQAGDDQELQAENLRNYEGGLRSGLTGWPKWALDAYLETHDEPGGPIVRRPGMAAEG